MPRCCKFTTFGDNRQNHNDNSISYSHAIHSNHSHSSGGGNNCGSDNGG